ncbi:MAG: polyphosphate:nucleotide phosphotransferase, family [Edaphobacter sp.]|nr:polyphosphate:nucleotide phosphotransferase, family [Edaphobacter sp.]
MKLKSPYLIRQNAAVKLSRMPSDDTGDFKAEETAATVLLKHRGQLADLQDVFYASQQRALLIVLQGMDTAGKDGTIRHLFSGLNPEGCSVTAFKVPTPIEARHDFLWRVHAAVPARGMIGIFNRSHYEDVLSPRVHKLISAKTVRRRFDDINEFEEMLTDNDVVILKFFLHISHEEQALRLQSRIENPDKHWKLDPADFKEREFWSQYEKAYEDLIAATSRKHAPWFVIPSDRKWYRNVAISAIVVDAMQGLKLKYPQPTMDPSTIKL